MKISFLVTLLLSLVVCGIAKPKNTSPYIVLRPTDTLHIQIIDNVYMNGMGERDRFHRIKESIEDVFEDISFPISYKIERFGSRQTPPNQPRLDIHIMKWGSNGFSEIEARFSASIRRDFDRNKLGVFFTRTASPIGGGNRVIRVHNEVMEEAIAELVLELNSRLSASLLQESEPESESAPSESK